MRVRVNGEEREVAERESVASLLDALGLDSRTVAVERNGAILERADYPSTELAEGDRLELVRFVQGG